MIVWVLHVERYGRLDIGYHIFEALRDESLFSVRCYLSVY